MLMCRRADMRGVFLDIIFCLTKRVTEVRALPQNAVLAIRLSTRELLNKPQPIRCERMA